MKARLAIGLITVLAAAAFAGAAVRAQAVVVPTKIKASLDASELFPNASAKARYLEAQSGNELELEREIKISLEDVELPEGETLLVSVNGAPVGSARLDKFGDAQVHLESELGDRIPAVASGAQVEVHTSTGRLVASGTFTTGPDHLRASVAPNPLLVRGGTATATVCVVDSAGHAVTTANDSIGLVLSSAAPSHTRLQSASPQNATGGCATFTLRSNGGSAGSDTYVVVDNSRTLPGGRSSTVAIETR